MMRSCKSSMYLSAQHMVSKKNDEITGTVIYAFVPHFYRHRRAQGRQQTHLDTANNIGDPPEHSLESRTGKFVYVSCSCYRRRLRFGGHHLDIDGLSLVANNLAGPQIPTFHLRETRSQSARRPSTKELIMSAHLSWLCRRRTLGVSCAV